MKKVISISLDSELLAWVKESSWKEKKSVSLYIEGILRRGVVVENSPKKGVEQVKNGKNIFQMMDEVRDK